jgi:hypothetical protein
VRRLDLLEADLSETGASWSSMSAMLSPLISFRVSTLFKATKGSRD